MEEKTVAVTKKMIGDTVYIVESAVSAQAKETVYNKVKMLILTNADKEN